MTFAIDGIFMSSPQPGGYKTYTTNLVNHLRSVDADHNYLLLTDREIEWEPQPNWRIIIQRRRGHLGFVWREQIMLPWLAQREKVSLLHCPGATGPLYSTAPVVVTIYDTIEFSQPLPPAREMKQWGMRVYSRFVQKHVARSAKLILTISEYSKNQIMNSFDISANRIVPTSLAPSDVYRQIDKKTVLRQSREQYGTQNHIMAFASAAPRKNITRLIEAFAQIGTDLQKKHPLALVCTHESARTKMRQTAISTGVEQHVRFVEQASDEDLLTLYNAAALFVFPSLEEGFGLPPLEAMACGTPVVASNASAMPEVLGDAALLVTPTDTKALADAIQQVLTNPGLADHLRSDGLARSYQFSWDKVAREVIAAYEFVAQNSPGY